MCLTSLELIYRIQIAELQFINFNLYETEYVQILARMILSKDYSVLFVMMLWTLHLLKSSIKLIYSIPA